MKFPSTFLPLLLAAALFAATPAAAQYQSHFTPATGFDNNMNVLGPITLDGTELTSTAYEIGAFCGDECRGSAFLEDIGAVWWALQTIAGNPGETITFALYDHVSGKVIEANCSTTVKFETNATIGFDSAFTIAFTSKPSHVIAVAANPATGGTATGGGTVVKDETCTVTATANEHWAFVNWTEDGEEVSTAASYAFTVEANRNLVANFRRESLVVATSANPAVGGTATGGGTVDAEATCTVTATANEHWAFVNWTEDGEEVSTAASYVFTVEANRNLVANFRRKSLVVVTSAVSRAFTLDTREGPFESDGTETVAFSSLWHGTADSSVTLLANGEPFAEGLSGESNYVWRALVNGTNVLTHVTIGVDNVPETATFIVKGLYPEPAATLRWKYAKNANGWFCAQVALKWHPAYADAISNMRLLFADRFEDEEALVVIETLDDEQTAYFQTDRMVKMVGREDGRNYYLKLEDGDVFSEAFLRNGYKEHLSDPETKPDNYLDGMEVDSLSDFGSTLSADDFWNEDGVLNNSGTSYSATVTVNGRAISLQFAAARQGLGRTTAYLVDPATVAAPLGNTETYRDVEYRVSPIDLSSFANLAAGDRAVFGVSDETMASPLASVPKAERKICLRVPNRDLSTVAPMADGKLAVLAWKSNGRDVYLPVGEPVQPKPKAATFTVRFLANGGTGTMSALTAAAGSAAALPANAFARKGWVFLGWALRPDGPVAYKNGASAKDLAAAGKTATLYAKWAKKAYKVKFFANDGTDRTAVQKMTWGKKAKLKANAFKRKGYVFKGWAKSKAAAKKGEVAYKNGKTVKNLVSDGKTVKLFAVWKKAQ